MHTPRFILAALIGLASLTTASAQPAFKLGVRPEFAPKAEIKLEDGRVVRTAVANDPGFRLLINIKNDGKSVATIEARSAASIDLPIKEPGNYTVALELFFPTFKTGGAQKGEFKTISNVLACKFEDGQLKLVEK
jgi:hypothetical protein